MFGSTNAWKQLYEEEKARSARLELELRQLNEMIRSDYQRSLADAVRALNAAIAMVRRGPPQ